MSQIHGSGTGNWSNTAIVDNNGRLWVSPDNLVLDGVKVRGSGLVVFPKEHDRQIQGNTYLCGSSFYDLPSLGSVSIFIPVGSCDVHMTLDSRSDGDVNLILMENVHVTSSGVPNYIMNEQRCSEKMPNFTIWTNPTVTTSGNVIHTAMFLGGSGAGTKFSSAPVGTGIHGGDMILCSGSAYLIKFENLAYRDITYDWNLELHEHC